MISQQPGGAPYERLAAQLRKEIVTGRRRPGQFLPSERTLQQQHDLARETVRRAIAVLRAEGLVTVQRGHGVVVREQPELEDLTPPARSTVISRMPTLEEKAEHSIDDGVPVFWVVSPDGSAQVYPADRWQLRLP